MTFGGSRTDQHNIPHVIVGGVWTLDEKMGNTYIHYEQANTLAQRDYKQPQAVIYRRKDDISEDNRLTDGK